MLGSELIGKMMKLRMYKAKTNHWCEQTSRSVHFRGRSRTELIAKYFKKKSGLACPSRCILLPFALKKATLRMQWRSLDLLWRRDTHFIKYKSLILIFYTCKDVSTWTLSFPKGIIFWKFYAPVILIHRTRRSKWSSLFRMRHLVTIFSCIRTLFRASRDSRTCTFSSNNLCTDFKKRYYTFRFPLWLVWDISVVVYS